MDGAKGLFVCVACPEGKFKHGSAVSAGQQCAECGVGEFFQWGCADGDAAQAVVRADCPGAVSYNLDNFEFEHVPRPMFLLDAFDDGSAPPGQFL